MSSKSVSYKWFNIWVDDKESVIRAMENNIASDLNAGYNPLGDAIRKSRKELNDYIDEMDREMAKLREMPYKQVEHWCYIDLKRRGAIE